MMTEEEKKMKRYTSAIERRLNLPVEIKGRVMSDFISSIAARREAGMTDEQIYAELGDPKKVAAELNEQMKEYTYRKSPWRFVFLAAAIYAIYRLVDRIWTMIVLWAIDVYFTTNISSSEAASVGIIGGADGPTAIFVTTPNWLHWMIYLLLAAVGIWGFLRLRKCKQK